MRREWSELRPLLAHERAVAVGETGLDYFRDYAPRHDRQRRLFDAQLELARRARQARRDPHARRRRGHARRARRLRRHRRPPLLLVAGAPRPRRSSAAGTSRSPATSPTRRRRSCARRRGRVPRDRLLAETDSPYLAPQPVRGQTNEPANVVHTLATLAEARGEDPGELGAQIDANATAAFAL